MTGYVAVLVLAGSLIGLVVLVAFLSRAVGRRDIGLSVSRSKNAFMDKFSSAISRPILRGSALIRGLRSWSDD